MSTELNGVDLARQALVAAREAAKKNGAARKEKPKRRTGTVVRRDGREPLGLGSAISMMMIERGSPSVSACPSLRAVRGRVGGDVQTAGVRVERHGLTLPGAVRARRAAGWLWPGTSKATRTLALRRARAERATGRPKRQL
ncbi:hypothetical protein [Streptomyces sp. NPDC097610]|uniref:hypothetical protein n=1 Tax=Streptomyces sp. NPDC097610 TaxID=3157227 RepID=UPI00332EB54A